MSNALIEDGPARYNRNVPRESLEAAIDSLSYRLHNMYRVAVEFGNERDAFERELHETQDEAARWQHIAHEESYEVNRLHQLASDRLQEIEALEHNRFDVAALIRFGTRISRLLQRSDFLEEAVKNYASHAWNDIQREMEKRWP